MTIIEYLLYLFYVFAQHSVLSPMELPMVKSSRFKFDQNVVEIFAARRAGRSVLEATPHENVDLARRDGWRASLDDEQTLSVAVVAGGIARLGAISNQATLSQVLLTVIQGADPDDAEDVTMRKSFAIALRQRFFGKPAAPMEVGGTKWRAKLHEESLSDSNDRRHVDIIKRWCEQVVPSD
jgi:hypothetical protein